MFKHCIVALKNGLGQRSALLAPSKTLGGRHEAWVCTTLSTSLSSPFPPSSFTTKGSTRKDENQVIQRVNTCYEWKDANPLAMIKSRNRHSIGFVFISLFSGIAITQAMPINAEDSIDDWYESRPPAQLCELYRSGAIHPDQIPGGRSSNPCANFPIPNQEVIKGVN